MENELSIPNVQKELLVLVLMMMMIMIMMMACERFIIEIIQTEIHFFHGKFPAFLFRVVAVVEISNGLFGGNPKRCQTASCCNMQISNGLLYCMNRLNGLALTEPLEVCYFCRV